jgi:hypothetical protein
MAPPTYLASSSSLSTSVSSSNGPPPTSVPAPAGSTQGSTSTTVSAAPTCATDRWSHLRPHLLQLWSLEPLCLGVPRTKEERCSGPRHSPAMWSAEGGRCKDRPRQLHHYGKHSRGRDSPHGYVLSKWISCCHPV